MKMTLDTNITIPDTLFLQKVDEETILLDTNTQEYFTLNEVGSITWEIIEEKKDLNKVCEEIVKIFEVDFEIAKNDILNFVEALSEKELIIIN